MANLNVTGNLSINGTSDLSGQVKVPTPLLPSSAVNKGYLDTIQLLWTGAATSGTITLNSSIDNWKVLYFKWLDNSNQFITLPTLSEDFSTTNNSNPMVFPCKGGAADKSMICYSNTDKTKITISSATNLTLVSIKGTY